jgi:hypothetical protein
MNQKSSIDAAAFVECVKLQHYDDSEAAVVDSFLAQVPAEKESMAHKLRVSRDALYAFLRL